MPTASIVATVSNRPVSNRLVPRISLVLFVSMGLSSGSAFAQVEKSANSSKFGQMVKRYFAKTPGYKTGDLITQGQTSKLMELMKKHGWTIKPDDEQRLLQRVLEDDAFLVQQFSSPKGREFLNKIRDLPEGIDRMDRIARMPQGKRDVNAMIYKIPNGDEWIEEMTTSKHGLRLSRNIARFDHNHDFDKATGRIYFVDQLVPELEKIAQPPKKKKQR